MPTRSILAVILLAAGTAFAIAQPASDNPAQPQSAPPDGPDATAHSRTDSSAMGVMPPGHKTMMGAGGIDSMVHHGMMAARGGTGTMPFDHIEGRIAFLKAEIGITQSQSARWTAFADALRADAAAMRKAHAAAAPADRLLSAPDRLDAAVQRVSAHLDGMKTLLAAEKPLYAVLSGEQKKIADELLLDPGMGMGPGMMGGHP